MIERSSPISDDELHAYVDGELDQTRRAAVEAWLASHPEDASRVGSWRAQAEMIQARYGGPAREPVPARLNLDRLARQDRRWKQVAVVAVAVAFIGGGAVGWFGRGMLDEGPRNAAPTLTAEALNAHRLYTVEVRHPVEVPAAEKGHLVQWLSKRLDHRLRAPDLDTAGLKLVGGRLLPGRAGEPAAFFMYQGHSGERFTIYCARTRAAETALRYVASGTVAAVYWVDRNFAYVISGPADYERLLKIAQTAYEQMDSRQPRT